MAAWGSRLCVRQGLKATSPCEAEWQTNFQVGDAIQWSYPLSSPSSSASNLSQHQGLFQWVSSLDQVAKVLEFQLQHQSFQWRNSNSGLGLLRCIMGYHGGSAVKSPPAMQGSISELGRSPGEGNGNPFQYSCLGNPTDKGAWRATVCEVAKSRTWLSS